MRIKAEKLTEISMARADMKGIPRYRFPRGYRLRPYRRGDEKTWVRILTVSEEHVPVSHAVYRKWFGYCEKDLKERQFFLVNPRGREIGTATAWFEREYRGRPYVGRIHWVAIVPGERGKGLAKPLISAVCATLKKLGHGTAFLTTENVRIPAITLYLKFGFSPEIKNNGDCRAWKKLAGKVKNLRLRRAGRAGRAGRARRASAG